MKNKGPSSQSYIAQNGQAVVEYLLLLAVVVSLIASITGIIKERFLGNLDNCTGANQSIACNLKSLITPGQFRYFKVRR